MRVRRYPLRAKLVKWKYMMLGLLFLGLLGQSNADEEGTWKSGEEIYGKICGHCHETGVGPIIRQRNLPPDYVSWVVRNGRGAMPAFRSAEIDDELLIKIMGYIR